MKRLAVLAVIAIAAAPLTLPAQGQQPYAGFEARPIKALSDQQLADLRAGRGMGLALAAELNGYPGPTMYSNSPSRWACPKHSGSRCRSSLHG